jgi:predicted transcriptional regulator
MNVNEKCVYCHRVAPKEQVKAYIAVCGHIVCDNCKEKIFGNVFTKGQQKLCPDCKTALSAETLFIRNYTDAGLTKELQLRKELLQIYVQAREDFLTQQDYNRYLEERDSIIHNLANDIDTENTKQKIEKYKADHKEIIEKYKSKGKVTSDRAEVQKKRQNYIEEELEYLKTRKKERDEILENLAYGRITVDEFIAKSKSMQEENKKTEKEIKEITEIEGKKDHDIRTTKPKELSYVPQRPIEVIIPSNAPRPRPSKPEPDINPEQKKRQAWRAAGYNESLTTQKLIQEALSGLYVN